MQQQIMTPMGLITIEPVPITLTSPLKLSRLYGYCGLDPIYREIQLIQHVIQAIATSTRPITQVIHQIVFDLGSANVRNRSGKRWTRATIIKLVRPIYGGHVLVAGQYVRLEHYPEIVPWHIVERAMSRVKGMRL